MLTAASSLMIPLKDKNGTDLSRLDHCGAARLLAEDESSFQCFDVGM